MNLEDELFHIIDYGKHSDIEENMKWFFCNSYRIKKYIDIALIESACYNTEYMKYILKNYKISNKAIKIALKESISEKNTESVKYIFNNYYCPGELSKLL